MCVRREERSIRQEHLAKLVYRLAFPKVGFPMRSPETGPHLWRHPLHLQIADQQELWPYDVIQKDEMLQKSVKERKGVERIMELL